MSFLSLALIAVVALAGPLLALPVRWRLPVVLGELLAGVVIGRTGFAWVDPDDHTFTLLANIGFALVMFVAGTHVPVRDSLIRTALGKGLTRAALAAGAAVVVGTGMGLAFGTGSHPTTRLCMEWLEAHPAPGKSVLDYGCGSGILAMVAKKLGSQDVAGVDIDPQAIESARANAERRATHAATATRPGSGLTFQHSGQHSGQHSARPSGQPAGRNVGM